MATKKTNPDFSVRGLPGLQVWSGRIFDEVLPELQQDRGRRVYREMSEQDPIIGGTLLGIELLARQVKWTIKPADVDDEEPLVVGANGQPKKTTSQEVADFIDGCLTDMNPSWGSTLSEILSMLVYGWSWLELIYKRREGLQPGNTTKSSLYDDGKIGWSGWHIRSQETLFRWHYENPDDTGELVAMEQWAPPTYQFMKIPRWKSLHFMTKSRKQNPEGQSILRNAYRSWYMKKNIEVIEAIGVERDLAGLPVLWAPQELFTAQATAEQLALRETLQKIVTSIKRDEQEGILMPMAFDEEGKNPLFKLELLSTGGDRQFDTNAIINRYDERIAMSMMADFLLMGHQAVGSFALSATKTNLFSTSLSAILDVVTAEVNSMAIPQLVLLNGWDLKYCPSLIHGRIEAADLAKVGEFLRQLNAAGMPIFPNRALEVYLLGLAGLPSDPGAGEMPLPGEDIQDEDLLEDDDSNVTGQQAKTGKDGDLGDLPTPGTPPRRKPAAPNGARAKVAASEDPFAAHEGRKHHRHFVPLAQRVAKVRERLQTMMDPTDYREFLASVMEAGQFSNLKAEHKAMIRQAEAAG